MIINRKRDALKTPINPMKFRQNIQPCKRTLHGVTCLEGEVLVADHLYLVDIDKFVVDDSPQCNGQCFNDYLTSQYLGPLTHYSCPDKCIYWSGLCRGVSFCDGDEEICGEDLRCPEERFFGNVTKHTMSTDPPRSYCFGLEHPPFTGWDVFLVVY